MALGVKVRLLSQEQAGHRRSGSGGSMFPPPSPAFASNNYSSQNPPPSPSATPTPNSHEFALRPTHAQASYSVYGQEGSYPPIKQTFKRLRDLLSPVYPELLDTLSYPLLEKDLVALQNALHDSRGNPVRIPRDVKEYLSQHDGQDVFSISSSALSGGSASSMGLVFGLWLMTADEIQTEWDVWRKLESRKRLGQQAVDDPFNFNSREEEERYFKTHMGSCPSGWVREDYSCPGWIPLIKDGMGNYIGIDLDPPTLGLNTPNSASSSKSNAWDGAAARHGQVIAFGREIDVKTVLFPGWGPDGGFARFLSSLVDDLESGDFASLGDLVTPPQTSASQREFSPTHYRNQESRDWIEDVAYASPSVAANVSRDAQPEPYSTEDGLGDLGYFEQDSESFTNNLSSERSTSTSESGRVNRLSGTGGRRSARGAHWRLKGKYSGMGVIEALCLRSQARWEEVDLYSSKKAKRMQNRHSRQKSEGNRVNFRIPSPAPLMQAEESDTDGQDIIVSPTSPDGEPDTPVSVVLEPPTPQKKGEFGQEQEDHPLSEMSLQSPTSPTRSSKSKGKGRAMPERPRKSVPPPAALDLPTMLDMEEQPVRGIEVVVK